MGGDAFGQPNITADNGMMTDDGFASQNRGTGIDNHMVFDGGMAFGVGFVFTHRERAECYALVNFNVVANDGGFTDDHSGAVVNKKGLANRGSRVNVYACFPMGMLGKNAWQPFYFLL
jgi:hypothetical protein